MPESPENETDAALAIRCQLGEAEAWTTLVERWHPRLWTFVYRMLNDQTGAEDVMQGVWLRVVRSMGQLRNPEALPSWLYRIARTAITDRLREQYRQPTRESLVEVSEIEDSPESRDMSEELTDAIDQLHPADREAVVLYYLQERSVGEVAQVCGVPPGTIKSRLHRARAQMRSKLSEENHVSK